MKRNKINEGLSNGFSELEESLRMISEVLSELNEPDDVHEPQDVPPADDECDDEDEEELEDDNDYYDEAPVDEFDLDNMVFIKMLKMQQEMLEMQKQLSAQIQLILQRVQSYQPIVYPIYPAPCPVTPLNPVYSDHTYCIGTPIWERGSTGTSCGTSHVSSTTVIL